MNDPTIADEDGPEIIGTKETVDNLGWIGKRSAEIAGIDTVVVSRGDFANEKDNEARIKKLKEIFNKAGMPDMPKKELGAIVDRAMDNDPMADVFDKDGDGKADIGLIVAPPLDITKQEALSLLTKVPADQLGNNLPGSGRDYLAAIMFHEARHVAQPMGYGTDSMLAREADADMAALREMDRAKREGLTSPGVNEAILEGRTVGALHVSYFTVMRNAASLNLNDLYGSHSTALAIQNPNGSLPADSTAEASTMLYTNSLLNMTVQGLLQDEAIKQMKTYRETGKHPENRIFDSVSDIGTILTSGKARAEVAESYIQDNPAIAHAALSMLREKGFIKDGTPEAAYADKVIGFFEKHVDLNDGNPRTESARELFGTFPNADTLPKAEPAPEAAVPMQNTGPKSLMDYAR